MRRTSPRGRHRLALLALLTLTILLPGMTHADPPTPVPQTTTLPPDPGQGQSPSAGEVLLPAAPSIPVQPTPAVPAEATPQATGALPQLLDPAAASASSNPSIIQGIVTLDVAAPETIRAGEYITYTYSYQNTGAVPISGVIVEARWANFSVTPTSISSVWQFCPAAPDTPAGCVLLPGSVQGPAVTPASACPPRSDIAGSRFCFSLGSLAAGQSGRFAIRVRSNRVTYPRTGQPLIRPAGSGMLYLDGSSTVTSEDTASTLVAGPVLVLTKTTDTGLKIYTGESAEFVIRVGNATGSGDTAGDQLRADARPATNLVLKDTFPLGGEFVSATGTPVVDATSKTVTWSLPGPLDPGQVVEFRVVFRKADVNLDCTRLYNNAYNVSYEDAAEAPLSTGARYRYTVSGFPVGVAVVLPLSLASIVASPTNVPFGDEADLTLVVQSYWEAPLQNVRLQYELQSNVVYIPDSAEPAPTATPNATQQGGLLTWTFATPAGSKTAPAELRFKLRVRAGYSTKFEPATGHAWLEAPSGLPSACSQRDGRATVEPRLRLTKITEADPATRIGSIYSVVRGQSFGYRIELTNNGPSDARGVGIADALPTETGANFSYVDGSATLNGQPRAPDAITNGQGGSLLWSNLLVPARSTLRIDYQLQVEGRDYWTYCNGAAADAGGEEVRASTIKVCVKINPRIIIAKTILLADNSAVTQSCASPGQEVRFRLTLTNQEPTTYRVGLYDLLGSSSRLLEFVRQESGYGEPRVDTRFGNGLQWPLADLAPNQQVEAIIVARIPGGAATGDYVNEVLFHNGIDVIRRIPAMTVKVHTPCIEYQTSVDRPVVSLQDRLELTLQIKNASAGEARDVRAVDLLPQGFAYEGLAASSDVKQVPLVEAGPDGRSRLSWAIPAIAPQATVKIKIIARAGGVVGAYENWVTLPSGGMCTRSCKADETGTSYAFQTVSVQPLITMEPKIVAENPDDCALPGQKRTYRLLIVNTNMHDYNDTVATLLLPLGLQYLRPLNGTPAPATSIGETGQTTVRWAGLRIPARPPNTFAAQVILEVELQVGQVFGTLNTTMTTTSPDGMIPRKEDVQDPSVQTCALRPAIAMDASPRIVQLGKDVLFQISLVNPTNSEQTATVEDTVPEVFTYLEMLAGAAPSRDGHTLSWRLTVPAATDSPGIVVLQFRARLADNAPLQSYTNTARVTASSEAFDTTYSSVTVVAAEEVFRVQLPLVRR